VMYGCCCTTMPFLIVHTGPAAVMLGSLVAGSARVQTCDGGCANHPGWRCLECSPLTSTRPMKIGFRKLEDMHVFASRAAVLALDGNTNLSYICRTSSRYSPGARSGNEATTRLGASDRACITKMFGGIANGPLWWYLVWPSTSDGPLARSTNDGPSSSCGSPARSIPGRGNTR
jgi:hypothetical protein